MDERPDHPFVARLVERIQCVEEQIEVGQLPTEKGAFLHKP